jgi:D-arabinose 1-dehydrogenase-like Zn-dependent alcohol dehydrogenase
VRDDDVKIDIKYCGICASDLHKSRNEWKNAIYPMVPGHEIVGTVAAVGSKVTRFRIGDTVGVGCLVDSCGSCESCSAHLEQYCAKGATLTYNSKERDGSGAITMGGYSDVIVVRESFVVSVPSTLPLAAAAPLLCAGITTYSPLRHWNVKAGDRVGIVGLGGLGSMGVRFAKALGASVVVFTTSQSKREYACSLGADDVIVTTDADQLASAPAGLNVILDTVSISHDLNPLIGKLAVDGKYILLGAPETPHPAVQPFGLIFGRRSLAGSVIGGLAETQEMLDFAAKHNITSQVEIIHANQINDALDRLKRNSDVRGRFVIDIATLRS